MIYLACFALSAFFAYLAKKSKKRTLFILFSIISIALPVLLAGFRDFSIGIDVKNYFHKDRYWHGAISSPSLGAYLESFFALGEIEFVFALFIGIIAQLTGSFRVFLFLAHLVIMVGMYIGAFRMKHRARPELILLLFYLLYFNNSLNAIRQYMALALVFAVFADLEQRKFLRYLTVATIAFFLHAAAILSIAPLLIFLLLYPRKGINTVTTSRLVFLCGLILLGTVCFIPTFRLMLDLGVLSVERYSFYLRGGFTRMSFTRMGLLALEAAGLALCCKQLRKTVPHFDFYLVHTFLFLCMQALSMFIQYGQRFVICFAMTNIITILLLPQACTKKKLRLPFYGIIFLLVLYFWYYLYVVHLSSQTYPYFLGV